VQPYLLIYLPTRPYTGVCLDTIIALTISDTFRIRDFMNYPFPMRHDTCDTLYRFGSTDRTGEVSWYVCWIEVNGNRDDFVRIPEANRPETRHDTAEGEIVRNWQPQITEATCLGKYTQLTFTVAQTIPSWFQRPAGQETRQRPSQ